MKHAIRNHFVSGLLLLAPFLLTLYFIKYLIGLVDKAIVDPVMKAIFVLLPFGVDAQFKILLTKLAIAFFVVCFVIVLGWAAQKFIFKKAIIAFEQFLGTITFFNKIYLSLREITDAFFGDKTGLFKRVVYVEYPRKGVYALGFVTQEKPWEIHEKTGKEIINVFLPHPPNPATGYFIFAPKEEVIESNMSVEEGIRLVISAGAAIPLGNGNRKK